MNDPDLIAAFKLLMVDMENGHSNPEDWQITITPDELERAAKYEAVRIPYDGIGKVTFIVRLRRDTQEEVLG